MTKGDRFCRVVMLMRLLIMPLILLLTYGSPPVEGREPIQSKKLPRPTGKYAVGRSVYLWVDESRREQFSKVQGAHRELMVYVWYPASSQERSVKIASYLPGVDVIDKSKDGEEMRDFWGDSWPLRSPKLPSSIVSQGTRKMIRFPQTLQAVYSR